MHTTASVHLVQSPLEAAAELNARRLIAAEFMYVARPPGGPARTVFDYALRSRLHALDSRDTVLWVVDSWATMDSLRPIAADYPQLTQCAIQANPQPKMPGSTALERPFDWEGGWRRVAMTDRWSRIVCALQVAALTPAADYLLMPAHDAIYTAETLSTLIRISQSHAREGVPAAVSPYTYHQHSPVPGANISDHIIALLNAAFNRDVLFGWKMRLNHVQAFWGKMGLLPVNACEPMLRSADTTTFEDDLHIDSRLGRLGFNARAWWVTDPKLYRQAPPVFSVADVRQVLLRTLHYSLNIPGAEVGGSILANHPSSIVRLRMLYPGYRRLDAEIMALIAGCRALIQGRLDAYGASWVDWGKYRYVIRVGDPSVETWQQV